MEIQAVRPGAGALPALPGELFVQVGLNIKERLPFHWTMIVELANGSLCCLPTSEAYQQGGYEAEFSAQAYGLYFLTEEAQPLIERSATELWAEVSDG